MYHLRVLEFQTTHPANNIYLSFESFRVSTTHPANNIYSLHDFNATSQERISKPPLYSAEHQPSSSGLEFRPRPIPQNSPLIAPLFAFPNRKIQRPFLPRANFSAADHSSPVIPPPTKQPNAAQPPNTTPHPASNPTQRSADHAVQGRRDPSAMPNKARSRDGGAAGCCGVHGGREHR